MNGDLETQIRRLFLHDDGQLFSVQVDANQYVPAKGNLAREVLQKHLRGDITIAVTLLQPGTNLAKAGCIDVDGKGPEDLAQPLAVAKRIKAMAQSQGLHAHVEFSGRRGFHVWFFAAEPLPGLTWVRFLKRMCHLAGYEGLETYPAGPTATQDHKGIGSKPIKLPCGFHQGGGWSGFLEEPEVLDEDGQPVLAPDQAAVLSPIIPMPSAKIASFALDEGAEATKAPVMHLPIRQFEMREGSGHPRCINHLLEHGAPTDLDYNRVNLTLARYALVRELTDEEAVSLAGIVAKRTSCLHSTSKGLSQRIDNFRSALASARRSPDKYTWSCGYVRSSTELVRAGGCPGQGCPHWTGNRAVLEERLSAPADRLAERECLTYLLHHQEGVADILRAQIPTEAFSDGIRVGKGGSLPANRLIVQAMCELQQCGAEVRTSLILDWLESSGEIPDGLEAVAEYIELLGREHPCERETFLHHLDRIRDIGLRNALQKQCLVTSRTLEDPAASVSEVLDDFLAFGARIQRQSAAEVQPMREVTAELVRSILDGQKLHPISTPSDHLNHALNGGLKGGQLLVIAGVPGGGKSTLASQVADFAAEKGVPTLLAHYEMSKQEALTASISRIGEIDSRLIDGRRFDDSTYPRREELRKKILRAADDFARRIGPFLTVLECGPETTVAKLKGAIAQVRHNAGITDDVPVLVVVDYLQLLPSGDERLDSGVNETVRVSRVATRLKQLARDCNAAVLTISDITKQAYQDAVKTGVLDMSALRDSFKIIHAADVVMLLQTGRVPVGRDGEFKDQLELLKDRYRDNPDKVRQIDKARYQHPLHEAAKASYARLSILKNRGGLTTDVLFVFEKAFHRFIPISLDLGEAEGAEDAAA